MIGYILKRLLISILLLFAVALLLFFLVRLVPGDPALVMVGPHTMTEESVNAIRDHYHLRDALPVQFLFWLGNAVRLDLGESFKYRQSVQSLIAERIPVSLQLILMSVVLALGTAIPLGVLSAYKRNSIADRAISLFALGALSSPVFLTATALILIFAYNLGWLPSMGTGGSFLENFRYMLLPAIALALNMLALTLRITRTAMIDALSSAYIRTARMKGLSEGKILWNHAFRNALIPVITVSSLQMGFLISGTVLVEYTFGIGGIGSLVIDSVQSLDYPLIEASTLFIVAAFLFINLVVDILYARIDPRVRHV